MIKINNITSKTKRVTNNTIRKDKMDTTISTTNKPQELTLISTII